MPDWLFADTRGEDPPRVGMILRLTGFTPPLGLGPLERREHWRPPELDACRHCPPSALAGALADQLTLELGDDFASRNLRRRAGALLSLVASTQPHRTTPGPTRNPHHGRTCSEADSSSAAWLDSRKFRDPPQCRQARHEQILTSAKNVESLDAGHRRLLAPRTGFCP